MRRVSFWLAVAGVSILSNFALEAITSKAGVPGLARFTAFTHRGAS
ncbi:hypothetical protein ACWGLK_31670 [Streptomyces albidoflavus]